MAGAGDDPDWLDAAREHDRLKLEREAKEKNLVAVHYAVWDPETQRYLGGVHESEEKAQQAYIRNKFNSNLIDWSVLESKGLKVTRFTAPELHQKVAALNTELLLNQKQLSAVYDQLCMLPLHGALPTKPSPVPEKRGRYGRGWFD